MSAACRSCFGDKSVSDEFIRPAIKRRVFYKVKRSRRFTSALIPKQRMWTHMTPAPGSIEAFFSRRAGTVRSFLRNIGAIYGEAKNEGCHIRPMQSSAACSHIANLKSRVGKRTMPSVCWTRSRAGFLLACGNRIRFSNVTIPCMAGIFQKGQRRI